MDKKCIQTIVLSALIGWLASLNTAWGGATWDVIKNERAKCNPKKKSECIIPFNKCTWNKEVGKGKCDSQIDVQNKNLQTKIQGQKTCLAIELEATCSGNKACFWVPTAENQGVCGWKGK